MNGPREKACTGNRSAAFPQGGFIFLFCYQGTNLTAGSNRTNVHLFPNSVYQKYCCCQWVSEKFFFTLLLSTSHSTAYTVFCSFYVESEGLNEKTMLKQLNAV